MFSPWVDEKVVKFAKRVLSNTGMALVSRADYAASRKKAASAQFDADFLGFISGLEPDLAAKLIEALPFSRAQLRQDLVVLGLLSAQRNGFFVEFGATDGVQRSNTFLLEKRFGWTGILAEPALVWHQALKESRNCAIDHRCVAGDGGQLVAFLEAEDAELSTLAKFRDADRHHREGLNYTVETVSLNDLLVEHRAPQGFDYLSLDTEGSEIEILENFDLGFWCPRVVTVEHNYTSARSKLADLFQQHGYRQVHSSMSRWDSWFVRI